MPHTWYDLMREVGFGGDTQPQPQRARPRPLRRLPGTMDLPRFEDMPAPNAWATLPTEENTPSPFAGYHAPRNMPRIGQEAERAPPTPEEVDRVNRYGMGGAQAIEAANFAGDLTGLNQVRRSAEGFTRGIMSNDPSNPGWEQGWTNGAMALGQFATPEMVGAGGSRFRFPGREPPRVGPEPRVPQIEPVTPIPVNPTREIGQNGMPIRPREPFRQSLVGGSDDLREATIPRRGDDAGGPRPGSSAVDAQGFETGRIVYRGLGRPYNAADGGYYQSFTSSLADAQEYGSHVTAARLRLGRNLPVDGGGNNFNAISVEQLPADVRARLHPSVGSSVTTDQIAHAAREAGYDSVTVRNVHDTRWGERPRGQDTRTIDFVFDTKNVAPLDYVPPQPIERGAAEKVKLSDSDRALLAELEADISPAPRRVGGESTASEAQGHAFDMTGYHATGAEFTEFRPHPYRGATFFARTPEGARTGARAGLGDGTGTGARNLMRADIRSRDVDGFRFTDAEERAIEALPQRMSAEEMQRFKKPAQLDDIPITSIYEPEGGYVAGWWETPTTEYVRRPLPQLTWEEAERTGRDVYGRGFAHYTIGGGEAFAAERAKARGFRAFPQQDEAGLSVGVMNPRTDVRLARSAPDGGGSPPEGIFTQGRPQGDAITPPPHGDLANYPRVRIGPRDQERDYGIISSDASLSQQDRSLITNALLNERARPSLKAGVSIDIIDLSGGRSAFVVYDARPVGSSLRVYGDAYIVPRDQFGRANAALDRVAREARGQRPPNGDPPRGGGPRGGTDITSFESSYPARPRRIGQPREPDGIFGAGQASREGRNAQAALTWNRGRSVPDGGGAQTLPSVPRKVLSGTVMEPSPLDEMLRARDIDPMRIDYAIRRELEYNLRLRGSRAEQEAWLDRWLMNSWDKHGGGEMPTYSLKPEPGQRALPAPRNITPAGNKGGNDPPPRPPLRRR